MHYILNEYVLFIFKIITITIIPIILLFITKNKYKKNTTNIHIENINNKYILLQKKLLNHIYEKNEKKIYIKKLTNDYKKLIKYSKQNLFIINFNNDLNASDIINLKDIISTIILISKKNDEVLLKLTSGGGFINNYGLAASQFKRLKEKNITLTISIDLIAASGGYLIASVANKIIASQFAIIGSIGVIGIIPNIKKLLNNNNIEIEHHTAGEYKNTLSMVGENTEKGRKKFIESLNDAHTLFKQFIKDNRPILHIDKVSTGEYWYGKNALKLNLIDKIQTSDEYIFNKINNIKIYEIKINKPLTFKQKITNEIKKSLFNNNIIL